MELGRPERAVFYRSDEPVPAVLGPGNLPFRSRRQRAYAVAVHEVEVFGFNACKQPAAIGRLHGVPSHVREPFGIQTLNQPWPDAAAFGAYAVLDPRLEQHLVTHADGKRRSPVAAPLGDDLWSANGSQARHARGERANARHYQAIGSYSKPGIASHVDLGSGTSDCPFRRADIARPVVEYDHSRHKTPLVLGMPPTRGSYAIASRSARARALNWHSTMWCGSRPEITVMCKQI